MKSMTHFTDSAPEIGQVKYVGLTELARFGLCCCRWHLAFLARLHFSADELLLYPRRPRRRQRRRWRRRWRQRRRPHTKC